MSCQSDTDIEINSNTASFTVARQPKNDTSLPFYKKAARVYIPLTSIVIFISLVFLIRGEHKKLESLLPDHLTEVVNASDWRELLSFTKHLVRTTTSDSVQEAVLLKTCLHSIVNATNSSIDNNRILRIIEHLDLASLEVWLLNKNGSWAEPNTRNPSTNCSWEQKGHNALLTTS